jgi:hypothetical protein
MKTLNAIKIESIKVVRNFETSRFGYKAEVWVKKVRFEGIEFKTMNNVDAILSHIWNTTTDVKCLEMQKSKSDKKILAYINEYSDFLARTWFQLI